MKSLFNSNPYSTKGGDAYGHLLKRLSSVNLFLQEVMRER